jgi:hypothetical protein
MDRVTLQTGDGNWVTRIRIRNSQVADADITGIREAAVPLGSGADRVGIRGIRRTSGTTLM